MYCHTHHCHIQHCSCDSSYPAGQDNMTEEELLAFTQEMKQELKDYTVDLKDQIFSYIDVGLNPVGIANSINSLKEQDTYILRTLTNKIDELNNSTNLSVYNLNNKVTKLEKQGADIVKDLNKVALLVESIAELSTIKNLKRGLRAYVKSYHAGLGKGGGYFTYDDSKSSMNDGGLVINGWVRDEVDLVSVDMFGAKGDGKNDDSSYINKAYNSGLSILRFPTGVYVVGTGVMIKCSTIFENVTITSKVGFAGVISTVEEDNVSLLGRLTIDCKNLVNSTDYGLRVRGDYARLYDIIVIDSKMEYKPFKGVSVRGDYCQIDSLIGIHAGYSTLQVSVSKNMSSLTIQRLISINHRNKGMVVNSGGYSIENINVTDIYTSTNTEQAASDGFLTDTSDDKQLLNIKNLHITNGVFIGDISNSMKIENVENFTFGNLVLKPSFNDTTPSSCARIAAYSTIGTSLSCHGAYIRPMGKLFKVDTINHHCMEDLRYEGKSNFLCVILGSDHFGFVDVVNTGDVPQTCVLQVNNINLIGKPLIMKAVIQFSYNNAEEVYLELGTVTGVSNTTAIFNNTANWRGRRAIDGGHCKLGNMPHNHTYNTLWIDESNTGIAELTQVSPKKYVGVTPPSTGTFNIGDYVTNVGNSTVDNGILKGWYCYQGGSDTAALWVEDIIPSS